MTSEMKKQVALDLLITPTTMITGIAGVSLMLLSEVLGGRAAFLGFSSFLVCIGAIATNFLFRIESTVEKALKQHAAKEAEKKEKALDDLDAKLVKDRDPRDQNALRNLRSLYDSFMEDYGNKKLTDHVSPAMVDQINEIFNTCVVQLERQFVIWETSTEVTGSAKHKLLKQREEIILDVEKSVESLADVINEVRALKINTKKGELKKLQERLDIQLSAAKATEEFNAELNSDNMNRFKEYQ